MPRGRSWRMRVTASLTSLRARSVSTSSRNSMVVFAMPSEIESVEVIGAFDAGYRVLDFLGDLGFEVGWGSAELGDDDRHHGYVDVRHAGDRHAREAEEAHATRTAMITMEGRGWRMAQAETLSAIVLLPLHHLGDESARKDGTSGCWRKTPCYEGSERG